MTTTQRFRDRTVTFANGSVGETVAIESASPVNYYQAISRPAEMPRTTIDGKLFLPPATGGAGRGKLGCVMIVPGSLGIAASHLAHAETITGLGLAAFVLDPFGPRDVASTVANQTLYSFAASAYDVLAALRTLAADARLDARRIGAQGHSRGGSAVLTAATRVLADAVLGQSGPRLRAVLPAYPWSGQQFLDPGVGDTIVRVLMGDRDEWCSAQQVQGHVQAIRLAGGAASLRLFAGATHSFDRGTPIEHVPDASVAPGAPTSYIAADGAFIHPTTGEPDPRLVDRDLMVYGLKAGYGRKGAAIGSNPGEADAFRADMVGFWRSVLAGSAA
jgi:dienelactone hydrolase